MPRDDKYRTLVNQTPAQMNFSKKFLLLLASLIFCFVIVNCSEIPSSSGEINELIVSSVSGVGYYGSFLPGIFFGSYKLIRPVVPEEIYLRLYFKYDYLAFGGIAAYFLNKYLRDPKNYRHFRIFITSFVVIFHLPSLFNLHWVASLKTPEDPNSAISEIFLTEGIFPFNFKLCFPYFYSFFSLMAENFSALSRLRRFGR